MKLLEIDIKISRETVRKIGLDNLSSNHYKQRFSRKDGWNKFIHINIIYDGKFSNLMNSDIQNQFEKYYLNTGNYANFGRKITNDFRNWIINNINDSKIKKKILQLIQNINHYREIDKYIIFHVSKAIKSQKTPLSLNMFSNKIKKIYLDISETTIRRIVKKGIFRGREDDFYKFFPIGGREKQLEIDIDNENLYFDDLLNSDLNQKFRDYTVNRKKLNVENIYPNLGIQITQDFIKWIGKKDSYLENLCVEINDQEQMLSFILYYVLETDLNLSEIYDQVLLIGLNIGRETIGNNALKFAFNNNVNDYKERFPQDIYGFCGTLTHEILRYLISEFFSQIYEDTYRYYSEVKIFPSSNKKADGFLKIDFLQDRLTNFTDSIFLQEYLNIDDGLINNLIGMQIDFTRDISDENILKKCKKYQNELILLIIVGTNWKNKNKDQKHIPSLREIKYPNRVLIISPKLFLILLNLNADFRKEFKKIIKYCINLDVLSLENYYDKNFTDSMFYDTEDLKIDLSIQNFYKFFFNPEKNKDLFQPLEIFKKLIDYCRSRFLNIREITRGNSVGVYYVFDSSNLRDFNNINNINFNLVSLAEIIGKYVGENKIFFKKITKGNRNRTQRVILVNKDFLDNSKNK